VKLTAAISAAVLVLAIASHAQCAATKGSGFPGDIGRPFNGLPLPDGPLPPRPPTPPLARGIAMDLALEAAKEAVAACDGYHVGVSIVDSAGMPKLYYIADGTPGFHAYTGFRKAYTALKFRMPTSQVGAATKTDPTVVAMIAADENLLSFAGGIPIFVGDDIVGAIGVSGAEPSAVDERCAQAGLSRVMARLR